MVSRKKILSKSRDDLNLDLYLEEEEDVWYAKEKLYKDHIQEVLMKWNSIDDEIWAKIIVMERNRRVAKAYARAPVLTINGSDDGFDGFRIGLCGFDNPMRDPKTEEIRRHIGQGAKVKMDDAGNIMIKRVSKTNVYIKGMTEENSIGSDIIKLPNGALELDKPLKLFDMKKFQQNISRELKRSYPDRRKLEAQCISTIAFVKNDNDLLDCPVWVMIINIVAMEILKSKLPSAKRIPDLRDRPRVPLPDEDPYSVAGSGSSGSSGKDKENPRRGDRPPKLPPRDNGPYGLITLPKPDYDDSDSELRLMRQTDGKKKDKKDKKYDDPYYCGLRARIPNFAKSKSKKLDEKWHMLAQQHSNLIHSRSFESNTALLKLQQNNGNYFSKAPVSPYSPYISNSDGYSGQPIYSHYGGRVPLPHKLYSPPLIVGDWE